MIAPNTRNQIRKRQAQQHMKTQVAIQRKVQRDLMAVLWQTITKNAELALEDGEEVPEGPPMLTIPLAELKEVPPNFGLTMQKNSDDDTLSVIAVVVKPKSNIILPGDG